MGTVQLANFILTFTHLGTPWLSVLLYQLMLLGSLHPQQKPTMVRVGDLVPANRVGQLYNHHGEDGAVTALDGLHLSESQWGDREKHPRRRPLTPQLLSPCAFALCPCIAGVSTGTLPLYLTSLFFTSSESHESM